MMYWGKRLFMIWPWIRVFGMTTPMALLTLSCTHDPKEAIASDIFAALEADDPKRYFHATDKFMPDDTSSQRRQFGLVLHARYQGAVKIPNYAWNELTETQQINMVLLSLFDMNPIEVTDNSHAELVRLFKTWTRRTVDVSPHIQDSEAFIQFLVDPEDSAIFHVSEKLSTETHDFIKSLPHLDEFTDNKFLVILLFSSLTDTLKGNFSRLSAVRECVNEFDDFQKKFILTAGNTAIRYMITLEADPEMIEKSKMTFAKMKEFLGYYGQWGNTEMNQFYLEMKAEGFF